MKTINSYDLFGHKGYSDTIEIDNTPLEPNRLTLLSKNFTESYKKQLETMINNENIKLQDVLVMVTIHNLLVGATGPILVTTKKYSRYKKEINDVMNWFYKRYRLIIRQMDQMLNGKITDLDELDTEK